MTDNMIDGLDALAGPESNPDGGGSVAGGSTTFTRRRMLGGLLGAGVVTIIGTSPVAGALRALAVPGDADNRVLVNVFLRGGADGLNIVVPHGDDDYYRIRGSIAQQRNTLSDLDGFFGLHQAFAPLHPLYREGELAIVQAAGSNDPTRSHFSAMDNMDLAFGSTGWMQRALASQNDSDPLSGLSIDSRTSPSLRGPNSGIAIKRLNEFRRSTAQLSAMRPTLEAMYGSSQDRLTADATLRAFSSIDTLAGVTVNPTVTYPRSGFARDLSEAAALIKADIGVRMVSVSLGGWDHHSDSVPRMQSKGAQFADALAAFKADLGDQSGRVMTVVMSEFGRTARKNGSGGTDHGHGNMMMVMGGALAEQGGGRVHLRDNRWVGLSDAQLNDNRDLAITTDFRSVLAELLDGHMGIVDPGIFPRYSPDYLGLLSTDSPPPTTVPASSTTTTTITRPTTTTLPPEENGSVAGVVTYVGGRPAAGVKIDLFRSVEGKRNGFLGSTSTDADGAYRFTSRPGPHLLTFIAPDGDAFSAARGRFYQPAVMVEAGQTTSGINGRLLGSSLDDSSTLGGVVTTSDGQPAAGVKIDLFVASADGSRGEFLNTTKTNRAGLYRFVIPGGCYILTMIAPDEQLFSNGRRWHQPMSCVDPGRAVIDLNGELNSIA